MNFKKLSLLSIILFVASISFADVNKKDLADFRDVYLKTHTLNAIYAVYSGDKPLLEGASGFYSKKIEQDPNSMDKLLGFEQQMPVASGTKQITAAAILRLKDQGKLDVTDVIAKYIPENSVYWGGKMPIWATQITIHQLLTHTGALQEYIPALKIDLTKSHKEINSEILQFAAQSTLVGKIGEKFQYCNTGYVILGLIIENVSGKELELFFKDEFFTPLDMKNTYLSNLQEAADYQNGKLFDRFPKRYFIIPGNVPPMFSPVNTDLRLPPFSDGGVVSTARDMNKWMVALYSGKILSADSLKLMTTPHVQSADKLMTDAYYGYGIYIVNQGGKTIYSHGGNAIAIRGEFSYIKELATSVIVLSNSMVHVPEALEGKIDFTQDHNQIDIMFFNKGLINILCK
jgi:CubicO group peptidase (beta-lactamase class C family)